MKIGLRNSNAALIAALMLDLPPVAVAEYSPDDVLPARYSEAHEHPAGGKFKRRTKRKWKGRDKVKAARKQRKATQ